MKEQVAVKFSNDLFFKYILSRDNEASLKLRKQVIKLIFGIDCKQAIIKNLEINMEI